MPIEGFDYNQFANDLAGQAGELVPHEFDDFQREYVTKKVIGNGCSSYMDLIYNTKK